MQTKILLKSKKGNPAVIPQQSNCFHKKREVPTNPTVLKVGTAALVEKMASHKQRICSPSLRLHRAGLNQQNPPTWRQHRSAHPPPIWNKNCPYLLAEQPATTTTWNSYTNSSLCFSQSQPFSSFHAPNTSKQSAFPLPSACPSLFATNTSLLWSKDPLQKGAYCHPAQGGKPSETMKAQAALFWGSGNWTVSPI